MAGKKKKPLLGESVVTKVSVGDFIEMPVMVKMGCQDKHNGHWYCVTHHESLTNQLEKDMHIQYSQHVLAWICNLHGPEVP